jgi:hypothetical protein
MSDPSDSQGPSGTKPHSSLGPVGAWIDKILPLLPGTSPTITKTAGPPAQAAPNAPPMFHGGVPVGPYEKSLDQQKQVVFDPKKQQEAAKKAYEKSEADKKEAEANKPFDFEEASRERYKQPSNPAIRIPTQKSPVLDAGENFGLKDDILQTKYRSKSALK